MMKIFMVVSLSLALRNSTSALLRALVDTVLALLGGDKSPAHLWWGGEVFLLLRQKAEVSTLRPLLARGWTILWVLRAQGVACPSCEGRGTAAPRGGLFAGGRLPCLGCGGRGLVAPAAPAFEWEAQLFWATPSGVLHFGSEAEMMAAFRAASAPKAPVATPAVTPAAAAPAAASAPVRRVLEAVKVLE